MAPGFFETEAWKLKFGESIAAPNDDVLAEVGPAVWRIKF